MNDKEKTKAQLIDELAELRQRIAEVDRRDQTDRETIATNGDQPVGETIRQDQLLSASAQISQTILSSLDLDQILDSLSSQIVETGVFRSLMVALVDEKTHSVEVVRSLTRHTKKGILLDSPRASERKVVGIRYDLEDTNITAEVARTGEMQVLEEWDRRLDSKVDQPERRKGQVSYFLPIKSRDRVLAVVATGSQIEEKEEVLHRIAVMRPLFDQAAIALGHAQLYREAQKDIAEREKAEEALRESEERFRSVTQSATDAIIIADSSGDIVSWNKGAQTIFGYEEAEVMVKPLTFLMPERYRDAHRKGLERYRLTDESHLVGQTVELQGLGKDGSEFPLELSLATWKTEEGTFYSGIIRDITERKQVEETLSRVHDELEHRVEERTAELKEVNLQLQREIAERKQVEEQLRQSQKMEAVGKLAGGVAHDFNNLLTVINGYSKLLLRRADDDRMRDTLEEIQKAGERAASLTHQLLAFSRRQVLQPVVLDLNGVLTDMSRMLQRLIGEDIELYTTFRADIGHIKADPGQLEQVLMNLAVNARDAMPQGGKLTIETEKVDLDEEFTGQYEEIPPGPYVMISLRDTGIGMDRATLEQIFEPFFTTKEVGRGTGLGLSTVYGIIAQSGGCIDVDSEVDKGTTFRIYLPQIEGEFESEDYDQDEEESPKGSETILVAEDEEMVRNLVCHVLTQSGYTVLDAGYGENVFEICKAHSGPIHLLVTDVVMPQMSGRALAEGLQPSYPEMKVLYMSGYTDDILDQHAVRDKEIIFISKPFMPDDLLIKVREVLDTL